MDIAARNGDRAVVDDVIVNVGITGAARAPEAGSRRHSESKRPAAGVGEVSAARARVGEDGAGGLDEIGAQIERATAGDRVSAGKQIARIYCLTPGAQCGIEAEI